MNIKLIMGPDRAKKQITVEENSTIESIALSVREKFPESYPYDILISLKNGRYAQLDETVTGGDELELLDMRNHIADISYQRSLCAVYLVAIRDVFESRGIHGLSAFIETSINQGLYTWIIATENASDDAKAIADRGLSDEEVQAVSHRMKEIVEQNIPFTFDTMSIEESRMFWHEEGFPEKAALLDDEIDGDSRPGFYVLNGYRNSCSGLMVPFTGYMKHFELRKYRDGILLRFPKYEKPEVMPEYVDDFRMYEAYDEEEQWLELLGTPFLSDMNRLIDSGGTKEMILLSEALHEKKIAAIADDIKSKGRRIILIAGPSSSGKTTFARRLCIQLRVIGLQPLYMGTDDYFVNREDLEVDENGEKNYENLDAVDIDLFCSDMNDLLAGKEVDLPEFDFIDGVKVFGKRITQIDNSQPIVIEGIHALNGKLTEAIDDREKYKIYISPLTQLNIDSHTSLHTTDARMIRRMVRDYQYRDRSAAETIREWAKVRAGENVNIFPYNSEADVLFNSTLAYEAGVLKKYVVPLLEEITPDQPEYSYAERILQALKLFRAIEDTSSIPNNSIVREFIGGSVFVE